MDKYGIIRREALIDIWTRKMTISSHNNNEQTNFKKIGKQTKDYFLFSSRWQCWKLVER